MGGTYHVRKGFVGGKAIHQGQGVLEGGLEEGGWVGGWVGEIDSGWLNGVKERTVHPPTHLPTSDVSCPVRTTRAGVWVSAPATLSAS